MESNSASVIRSPSSSTCTRSVRRSAAGFWRFAAMASVRYRSMCTAASMAASTCSGVRNGSRVWVRAWDQARTWATSASGRPSMAWITANGITKA